MTGQTHLIDDSYLSKHRLTAGALGAPVALCALWKDLSKIDFSQNGALEQLALVGNLYTLRGIGMLLRGLWRLPSLRHIVVWGPDTQHTGEALLKLWADGMTADHYISGMDVELDAALPQEAIDHLRENVQLHDMRKERQLGPVLGLVSDLETLPPHGEPRTFPEIEPPVPDTLPSLGTGFRVSAERVADAWSMILDRILRFGVVKESEYDIPQRELLNLTTIVTDEDSATPFLPDYLLLSKDMLENYTPSVTDNTPPDGISYTYGNRLRGYFGVDQVNTMVSKLAAAPHSRRATAVMWDPRSDPDLDTPPCLTQVVTNVVDGRLFLSYIARSQDMYGAWPQNTFAMRRVQASMAAQLGLELGPITSLTVSAHLYQQDWAPAEEVVSGRERAHRSLKYDPQGNIIINVQDGQINVEILDPSGQQIVWHSSGKSASELGNEIAALELASLPAHYIYIGRELQRAEDALLHGESYNQDKA